jgi:hypothetical protein
MPFALLFVGLILVTAGVRGKTSELYGLVKGDIENQPGRAGFIYWLFSILVIGSLGYIDELKPISRAFMALVIVVLFLKAGNPTGVGGGLFASLNQALKANPVTPEQTVTNGIETPIASARPTIGNYPINLGTGITGIFHGVQSDLQDFLQQNSQQ